MHCPPCQTTYKQTILVSGFWRRVVDGQVRGGGPVCHFRNDRFDVHGVRRSRVPDLPARAATAAAADQPAGQRQALQQPDPEHGGEPDRVQLVRRL